MNTRKIKHKIALSCNGDLKKYFNKVEKVNKILNNKNFDFSVKKNIYIKL